MLSFLVSPVHEVNEGLEYLKDLVHRAVLCDRCVSKVEGEWFHCACCPIDLCDQCESVDTHAPEHAFVVFKSTVSSSELPLDEHMANSALVLQIDIKVYRFVGFFF